ncbi:hypothetical protein GCM10009836_43080 [Pseudonocardia ailaonensis]|uniref:Site-specific integrase n=2 Tax=Pseudonocardia ailaonensis TaxID=367279 RepID=A0ABN2N8Y7_9PSEU
MFPTVVPCRAQSPRKRSRGSVDLLPSGAYRVRVYAGVDAVSGGRNDLIEIVPPGPRAQKQAEEARTRMLNEVDERRNPRTAATLDQLLDRYLMMIEVGASTKVMYERYLQKHVRPFLGRMKAGAIGPDELDSLYGEMRRCRIHCKSGQKLVDHRTPRAHECDGRCRPHVCRPLSNTTILHVHHVLSGAYRKAVRWRWVSVSPVAQADAPAPNPPDPQPPTPAEAARLIEEASHDPDWGALVWFAITTGARRGEICALRWERVDFDGRVVTISRAIATDGHRNLIEKSTKTHQQRRLAFDDETLAVLIDHRARAEEAAAQVGEELSPRAFVFSQAPDSMQPPVPSSVGQRYTRMAKRLGLDTTLQGLRHYSATELIAAGMDIRTVAGRLGHSGGGITTLRVYAAWLAEADQRAAKGIEARMPERPRSESAAERARRAPRLPSERVAAGLVQRIESGEFAVGEKLPSVNQLAAEYSVGIGTVYKAFELLRIWGAVQTQAGNRPVVLAPESRLEPEPVPEPTSAGPAEDVAGSPNRMLDFVVRRRGYVIADFSAEADTDDAAALRELLVGAVRRDGRDPSDLADFTMEIADPVRKERIRTFVAV